MRFTNCVRAGRFLLAVLVMSWASSHAATINEVRIDHSGSDVSEYFELFGTSGESLGGLWYLVIGDGAGGSGVLEAVVDLASMSIPSSGFFLAAESTFENGVGEPFEGITPDLVGDLNFENGDNVTHLLVSGLTAGTALGDDLDTDDDGVLDVTPWASIVDGVDLVETVGSGDLVYAASLGFSTVGPDGGFVPAHAYRSPDGTGVFVMGDFAIVEDTAGTSNPVPVPEPSSLVLFPLAAWAFFCRRRSL